MTSENDAEFVKIMMQDGDWQPGSRMHRLALLARRGAEAAHRIEQLEAALDILQAAMTAKKPIPMAFKKAILEACAALEERT